MEGQDRRHSCHSRPGRPSRRGSAGDRRLAARQAHRCPAAQPGTRRRERPAPPPARPRARRRASFTVSTDDTSRRTPVADIPARWHPLATPHFGTGMLAAATAVAAASIPASVMNDSGSGKRRASNRRSGPASCRLATTVRGVQIGVICSRPSSVGREPDARSHAGYGQVSAGLGFAYPGRPVVWMGSGAACSPDLPAAGNPWRGRRTLMSVGRFAVLLSSGGPS